MTNLGETIPNQSELSDETLARQRIGRELPQAQGSLDWAKKDLERVLSPGHRPYRPTHPGPRPHPEAGGMDHQDWEIAALEYRDFEETDEVSDGEDTVSQYEREVDDLTEAARLIEAGDARTITFYARAERDRLEKEAKEAALQQIRAGKELPLGRETYAEAARILDVIGGAKLKPGETVGPNGWQFAAVAETRDTYKGAMPYGYVFHRNPGQGTFGAYTDRIIIAGKSYNPTDISSGVTVQYFELPETVAAVESPHSGQILLTAEEVSTYKVHLDEQGIVRQSEYCRGIAMDDRRPKNFIYEAGETGITTLHLGRADYKGDTSLVIDDEEMQKLRGLLAGLTEDVMGFGAAAGYDPDAPKPSAPLRPLADVFRDVQKQADFVDAGYWQGQSMARLSSATSTETTVEQSTNHHGGHQYIGAIALKTNGDGMVTTYSARVNTMSWAHAHQGPLHGTYEVKRHNREGELVYSFLTNRPGAAEKLVRLSLRHIAGGAANIAE